MYAYVHVSIKYSAHTYCMCLLHIPKYSVCIQKGNHWQLGNTNGMFSLPSHPERGKPALYGCTQSTATLHEPAPTHAMVGLYNNIKYYYISGQTTGWSYMVHPVNTSKCKLCATWYMYLLEMTVTFISEEQGPKASTPSNEKTHFGLDGKSTL